MYKNLKLGCNGVLLSRADGFHTCRKTSFVKAKLRCVRPRLTFVCVIRYQNTHSANFCCGIAQLVFKHARLIVFLFLAENACVGDYT